MEEGTAMAMGTVMVMGTAMEMEMGTVEEIAAGPLVVPRGALEGALEEVLEGVREGALVEALEEALEDRLVTDRRVLDQQMVDRQGVALTPVPVAALIPQHLLPAAQLTDRLRLLQGPPTPILPPTQAVLRPPELC